jgi:DNA polymerase V
LYKKQKQGFMVRGKQPKGNAVDQAKGLPSFQSQAIASPQKSALALVPSVLETRIAEFFVAELKTRYRRPLYEQPVAAGFPSPAEDHIDKKLDLNRHYIKNPAATFFVKVDGDSMVGAGIHSGDTLIVDCSLEPTPGKVVIAVINGEHTVKRLKREGDRLLLMAENPNYPPIEVSEQAELHIWGVVTCVLHQV